MAEKSREREASWRFGNDFMRILLPEIEPSLKAHKIQVSRDTKLAFLVGAEVSQRLSTELFNQLIMDLGYDPAHFAALKAHVERKNLGGL